MLDKITAYLEEIKHLWPLITLVSSLLTFFLGLYFGHRAAIVRDKRKELNEIIEPIRLKLRRQVESMDSGRFLSVDVKKEDFYGVIDRLSPRNAESLQRFISEYLKANSSEGLGIHVVPGGNIKIGDFSPAHRAAKNLLDRLPVR